MTVLDTDVCIVGAGPGGALLGLLLARAGVSTVLLERHESINKEFRGEHLNQEGKEILEEAGLYASLQKMGLLPMEEVEYVQKGRTIKKVFPDKGLTHTGIHVPQSHLLKVILDEAKRVPTFQLFLNSRVMDILSFENKESTSVIVLMNGVKTEIRSRIIVGADGRFSTIRKKANFPVTSISHGYDLLWARVPAPANWRPTIKMVLAKDQQLALFTQYGNYIQIGWNIPENSFSSIRKESFQPFIQTLVGEVPELEQTVRKHIQSWKDFVLLKVVSSKSSTWVQDNVVLLGDAAHTMSPTGAFGLNSALKDAEVLAKIIPDIISNKQDIRTLKRYEERRMSKVDAIQMEQLQREANFKNHFLFDNREKVGM
ncbi:FAD-dependent monooxygenase [Bacillus sp. B1-b2]|uniref:FAD-dependent monooxygenase n=1 Tax=Bacillus sp. B1-b2 TaxID=2653201 RepID=UPI0012618446|nr:FAD-dependent monooxygenase [Bacillus sp. B1-b2]KAB7666450.1 FAD-binding protein [Bacillus sp. B1-b2]